jgi:serine/threonine-protein kinase
VISSGPEDAEVPNVVGLSEANATDLLEDRDFVVEVEERETVSPGEIGRVLDQDPSGGADQAPGSTVTIVVGVEPVLTDSDDGGE